MKDLHIKKSVLQRELIIWIVSLLFAVGVNVYVIIVYNAPWTELVTQIHYVFVLSLVVYFIIFLIRGAGYLVRLPFRRKG
ncbi:MAG: hypothetical protein FJ215_12490 [Ignavibacteria bacterium]|nr:hypothetical protein [Ignavibacteria bacterium]